MKLRYLLITAFVGMCSPVSSASFNHSFEDEAAIKAWTPDPGITLERSNAFSTDGEWSLKLIAEPGVPWFGMRKDVSMSEFRNYEYLEFDLKTITPVNEFALELRADKFQNLLIKWDQLKAQQTIRVKVRIADNEIVRFGDTANLSFWFANRTKGFQSLYIDNLRLTGRGEQARRLEALRPRVAKQNAGGDFLRRIDQMLAQPDPLEKEAVDALIAGWSQILLEKWREAGKTPFVLLLESSMRKVWKSTQPAELSTARPATLATLEMARNEYESFQLLVVPSAGRDVENLSAESSDLCSTSGGVIPAKDVVIQLVDEVDIGGVLQFPGELVRGQVPDPLLPNGIFSIAPGRLQSLWVTVFAPPGAEPGTYEGHITVSAPDTGAQVLSLRVTLRDILLPEKSSLKTIFTLWSHNWVNFYHYAIYPKDAWFYHPSFEDIPMEKKMALITFCNRYRVGVSEMMTMNIFRKDEIPAPGLREMLAELQNANSSFIIAMLEGYTVRKDGSMDKDAVALIGKNVRETLSMIPPGTGYVYMLDEPHRQPDKGGWDAMQKEAEMIHAEAPGAKTFLASGVNLPPASDRSVKDIDAFAMLWDRTPLQEAANHQKKGREIWWYGANVISKPYPNWGLDYEAICPRIMPLMTFKFKMDGILHWGSNLWGDDNCDPNVKARWPDVPWKSTGWPYQPGEGHVFYPGRDGEMWPSIRLENWRDGMEDYEYLILLKSRVSILSPADKVKAGELLGLNSVVNEPYDFTRDPEDLRDWRKAVGELLEKTNKP